MAGGCTICRVPVLSGAGDALGIPASGAAKGATVNAYEQLGAIRDQLELNGAHEDTIALVDKFITRAVSERDSATSVAQIMMLRHLLKQREALDNYAIYNDLQEVMSGFETRRVSDDDVRPAYEENDHRPRPHSYYRSIKTGEGDKKK